jgi:DNA repair exonuclease SbcCD ATPase subunit
MANRSKNANIKVSLEGDPKGIINAASSAQHAINKLTKELGVSRKEATAYVGSFDKLDRVKGFQTLQDNLKKNQSALAAAKQRARELTAEYRKTGDAMAKLGAEGSRERVQGLSSEIRGQTEAIRAEGDALRELGVDTKDLAGAQKKLTDEIDDQERGWKAAAVAAKRAEQIAEARAKADKIATAVLKKNAAEEKRIADVRNKLGIGAERAAEKKIIQEKKYQKSLQTTIDRIKKLRAEQALAVKSNKNFARYSLSVASALRLIAASAGSALATLGGFSALRRLGGVVTDFNATIEGSRTGIAAIVRAFDESEAGAGKYERSMKIAESIQKNLQLEGLKTTATYKELLTALQEGIAPAMKQGFNPEQVVKFTSAMTKSAAALSLPMDQLGQEIRAILDGTIDGNARIATVLGITNEKIKEMADQGQLYDYLMGKLSAFGRAGDDASKQWTGAVSNMQDAIELAFGQGFEDSFNQATKLVLRLTDAIVDIDEEAGTFTFNEKLSAAIKEIDDRIEEFLKNVSPEDIENAIAVIANSAKELLNVVLTITEAGLSVVGALGPAAPLLVKIAGYMAAIGGPAVIAAEGIKLMVGQALALKAGLAAVGVGGTALLVTLGQVAVVAGSLAAIYKAVDAYGEMRDVQNMSAEAGKRAADQEALYQDRLSRASAAAEKPLKSYKQVQEAYKQGVIDYDALTDTYSKGSGLAREAAEESKEAAEEQQKVFEFTADSAEKSTEKVKLSAKQQKKALGALKKEYQSLVKEIESVEKQLTKLADEGAADQLKFANAARSPIEAWNAQKKAVQDLAPAMAAAKAEADKLAAAGDIEGANKSYARAVELGKQMRAGIMDLATEVKGNFTPAMQSSLDTAKNAAKDFGDKYTKAMQDAKKAGEALKSTTESLADAQQGLAAAQRDAARDGMTAAQVYQDVASEQRELEEASKAAAQAGNYDLAIAKAREARQVASELNQEVKNGEQVVVSAEQARRNAAQAGISARQLEIEALKQKRNIESQAEIEALDRADKLRASKEAEAAKVAELEAAKSAVVKTEAEAAKEAAKLEAEARQQITDILQAQKDVLTELADQKNAEADWTLGDAYTEAGESAKALFDVTENIKQQLKDIPADAVIDWGSAWDQIEADGVASAAEVDARWDQATRDRYITTYVKEVQQRSGGGFAGPVQGLAGGGQPRRLSSRHITGGAGGVDRFGPVMLDYKEFVLQRRSVHAPELGGDGLALAWAHNRQDWGSMHSLLSNHLGGGAQIAMDLPAVPAELSGGGRADRRGGNERTLVFNDPATKSEARVSGSEFDLSVLEKQLRHRGIVSSR